MKNINFWKNFWGNLLASSQPYGLATQYEVNSPAGEFTIIVDERGDWYVPTFSKN